jgi:hypothetical protein
LVRLWQSSRGKATARTGRGRRWRKRMKKKNGRKGNKEEIELRNNGQHKNGMSVQCRMMHVITGLWRDFMPVTNGKVLPLLYSRK